MNASYPTLSRHLRPMLAAVAGIALVTAPAPITAQSGPEVLRTAMEQYAERHEGIENYTLVQSVMGFESTTYFEREMVDGIPVFLPRSTSGSEAAQQAPQSPWEHFDEMEERAEHRGFETVDGTRTHVVEITDVDEIDIWDPSSGGMDFRPETLTLFIGEDDYLIRQMHMTGSATAQDAPQTVSVTATFSDYREVDGLTHPHLTTMTVEGLQSSVSEEQRASMMEMMEQMENMPEAQRAMMRRMMGDQFEQIERMLTEGAMDLSIEVTEIRVNAGPPGDA